MMDATLRADYEVITYIKVQKVDGRMFYYKQVGDEQMDEVSEQEYIEGGGA